MLDDLSRDRDSDDDLSYRKSFEDYDLRMWEEEGKDAESNSTKN
jgi:hypothetical protein